MESGRDSRNRDGQRLLCSGSSIKERRADFSKLQTSSLTMNPGKFPEWIIKLKVCKHFEKEEVDRSVDGSRERAMKDENVGGISQ